MAVSRGRMFHTDDGDLRFGMICSAVFHVLVVLLALFGLPQLTTPPPEISEPVVVELAQLGDKTNPPPKQVQAPKPEEKPAEPEKKDVPEPPKPEPKPLPPEPVKPPPPPPEPVKPPPPPPEPPKPEPPKPPPPKPPEPEAEIPLPDKKPPPPKPPEPPKPPPPDKVQDVKPPPKKPQPPDDFDSLLKSVDKLRPTAQPTPAPQPQNTPAASKQTVTSNANISSEPVSMSDKDYVAGWYRKCWNFDPGARDAGQLIVKIHVLLNPDGSVVRADIVDDPRYNTNSYYQAAADSARRAVYTCPPIKLPPGKYDALKDLVLNFDPRDSVR